jgi:hypothetical protein
MRTNHRSVRRCLGGRVSLPNQLANALVIKQDRHSAGSEKHGDTIPRNQSIGKLFISPA